MTTAEQERPQGNRSMKPVPWYRIVGLLLVAPASAALGFVAVVYSADPSLLAIGDGAVMQEGTIDGGTELDGADEASLATSDDVDMGSMRSIPYVTLGEPYYWRCWNAGEESPLNEDACDRMRPFERVVASRLGVVVKCFERLDRPDAKGVLSLAIDVDFGEEPEGEANDESNGRGVKEAEVGFWSGRSTTLEGADTVINCLRSTIEKLPVAGIRHKRQRYTIFFPVEFRGDETPEKGRAVELVLDRVRLREAPVKGKIVGRLAKGEPVLVFEVQEGWARIKTADGREGWIFDDAITSQEP